MPSMRSSTPVHHGIRGAASQGHSLSSAGAVLPVESWPVAVSDPSEKVVASSPSSSLAPPLPEPSAVPPMIVGPSEHALSNRNITTHVRFIDRLHLRTRRIGG